ncbi:hypothetical protein [Sorangium sp. So ce861]|uniref:hypothetical protein n=1 Tax=Sorangium sp. So ce861 TaxID=3133323 RepID=UPI003F5D7BD1
MATVYIHGRADGDQTFASYWSNSQAGPNPLNLSWNASLPLAFSIPDVARDLDTICAPALPCRVVCHSAGCLLITRLLAENPGRWSIGTVYALAGAQGGSEWANLSSVVQVFIGPITWVAGARPIDFDLSTVVARNTFNHNNTSNATVVTVSGDYKIPYRRCKWYQLGCHAENAWIATKRAAIALVFPGDNDMVVAMHSSASFREPVASTDSCSSAGYWTNHRSFHNAGGRCCQDGFDVPHGYKSTMIARSNTPWSVPGTSTCAAPRSSVSPSGASPRGAPSRAASLPQASPRGPISAAPLADEEWLNAVPEEDEQWSDLAPAEVEEWPGLEQEGEELLEVAPAEDEEWVDVVPAAGEVPLELGDELATNVLGYVECSGVTATQNEWYCNSYDEDLQDIVWSTEGLPVNYPHEDAPEPL